jgi:paraquat-inducible protein B
MITLNVSINLPHPVHVHVHEEPSRALVERVAQLESTVNALQQGATMQFADLNGLVAALNDRTNALAAKQADTRAAITTVRVELDTMTSAIADLRRQLAGTPSQAAVDQLGASITSANAALGGVEASMSEDVSTLQSMGADPANPLPAPTDGTAATADQV